MSTAPITHSENTTDKAPENATSNPSCNDEDESRPVQTTDDPTNSNKQLARQPTDIARLHLLSSRLQFWKSKNRSMPFWGFLEAQEKSPSSDEEDEKNEIILYCTLCNINSPSSENSSLKNKRERKGIFKYSSAIGTRALRRHFQKHHPCELLEFTQFLEEQQSELRKRCSEYSNNTFPSKRAKAQHPRHQTAITLFSELPKYKANAPEQLLFHRDLVNYVALSFRPLSTVDDVNFKNLILHLNPRVTIPSRRTLTDTLIPETIKKIDFQITEKSLDRVESVTISFDLWMSQGNEDTFDVYAHYLDDNLQPQHVHLALISCNDTVGSALSKPLKQCLDRFKITPKVIAHVSDGGSNMRTCVQALNESVGQHALTGQKALRGNCISHLFSGKIKDALSKEICLDFNFVSVDKTRGKLQKCLTWTKKSGKGRREWLQACESASLKGKVIPTPVNTRWASQYVMMKMMFEYRKAVEYCFSSQPKVSLQLRVPSQQDWLVTECVISVLTPIVNALIYSQTKNYFLISDAIVKCIDLHGYFNSKLSDWGTDTLHLYDKPTTPTSFTQELSLLKKRMVSKIVDGISDMLTDLTTFNMNSYYFMALALDPRFKSLSKLIKFTQSRDDALYLANQYDEHVVIPAIVNCGRTNVPTVSQDGKEVSKETESIDEEGLFSEAKSTLDEQQCARTELAQFRAEKYIGSKNSSVEDATKALNWLQASKAKFPRVSRLAQAVLGIVPTQADNERTFSIAGLCSSLRRNRLGRKNLANLVHIACNKQYTNELFSDFDSEEIENSLIHDELLGNQASNSDTDDSDTDCPEDNQAST